MWVSGIQLQIRSLEFLVQHLSHHDDLGQLWTIVKMLLILSHGQAMAEKGFSINRQIVVET